MRRRASSSRSSSDVVVLGGANTDYLVRGSQLPEPGETLQGDHFEPSAIPTHELAGVPETYPFGL